MPLHSAQPERSKVCRLELDYNISIKASSIGDENKRIVREKYEIFQKRRETESSSASLNKYLESDASKLLKQQVQKTEILLTSFLVKHDILFSTSCHLICHQNLIFRFNYHKKVESWQIKRASAICNNDIDEELVVENSFDLKGIYLIIPSIKKKFFFLLSKGNRDLFSQLFPHRCCCKVERYEKFHFEQK